MKTVSFTINIFAQFLAKQAALTKNNYLKSVVQVEDPSHSMCRKIMWELDFHNNMLIYTLQ